MNFWLGVISDWFWNGSMLGQFWNGVLFACALFITLTWKIKLKCVVSWKTINGLNYSKQEQWNKYKYVGSYDMLQFVRWRKKGVGKNSSAKLSPLQCCKAKEKRRISNQSLSLTRQTLGCIVCVLTQCFTKLQKS